MSDKNKSNGLSDLVLLLAELLPEEQMIEILHSKILEYKANKTEENLKAVEGIAMIFLTKRTIGKGATVGDPGSGGVEKFKSFMDEMKEGHELISRLKGTNKDLYKDIRDIDDEDTDSTKIQGEGEE